MNANVNYTHASATYLRKRLVMVELSKFTAQKIYDDGTMGMVPIHIILILYYSA